MEYRYPRFRRELMEEDKAFSSGPEPGETFPDFDLPTTEDGRLRKQDLAGGPALITLASFT